MIETRELSTFELVPADKIREVERVLGLSAGAIKVLAWFDYESEVQVLAAMEDNFQQITDDENTLVDVLDLTADSLPHAHVAMSKCGKCGGRRRRRKVWVKSGQGQMQSGCLDC